MAILNLKRTILLATVIKFFKKFCKIQEDYHGKDQRNWWIVWTIRTSQIPAIVTMILFVMFLIENMKIMMILKNLFMETEEMF